MSKQVDLGEIRILKVKIAENQKQLKMAEELCDGELIKKYTYNIKLHEKQLKELE